MKTKVLFLLGTLFLLVLSEESHSQGLPEVNHIENDSILKNTWKRLAKVEKSGKNTFSILHLGDSHIQSDLFTSVVRNRLQDKFGNAGRGFVFPYFYAKSFNPKEYTWNSSKGRWQSETLVNYKKKLNVGVAGYALGSYFSKNVRFRFRDENTPLYFTQVSLFVDPKANVSISRTESGTNLKANNQWYSRFKVVKVETPKTNGIHFHLKTFKKLSSFYGMSLETGKSGILYHNLGVNSAKYRDYNQSGSLWLDQGVVLKPDLVIISLGTNDAQDLNLTKAMFKAQVKSMVLRIKKAMPKAEILLTTPPSSYYRKQKPNALLPPFIEAIHEISIEEKCAFWNLFELMGGPTAVSEWVAKDWAKPDLVHFTPAGYEWMGNKFYEALRKSYDAYVGN